MPRLRLTYRDSAKPPDEIKLGAFSQIAAKRRYGLDVLKAQDPEASLFAAFVELEGPEKARDPDTFDIWLMGVEEIELVNEEPDPDNPPPAETPSSDTSPESPPTLE